MGFEVTVATVGPEASAVCPLDLLWAVPDRVVAMASEY